ncbi:MAG: VOC family protein [Oscillospiraceae bacterium]|nr:VOC family protein [Oscillospiraceae bacterium]
MIKGIHHISMKCGTDAEFQKAKDFYLRVLGLKAVREWPAGIMIDTGCGLIEIFSSGTGIREQGAIRHFALLTDDTDGLAERIREAGYDVFIAPNDRVIPSEPPFPLRMAFCTGPLGEQIELFQEL